MSMSHVFVSYSTHNAEYANKLAEKLRLEGFDVWIDKAHLRSSDNWWESIIVALRSCSALIVVMTAEAKHSKWVQREVTLADNWHKPIFPLLLDGENWEIFVLTQYEDVRPASEANPPSSEFFKKLAQVVPRQLKPGKDVTSKKELPVNADNSTREASANPPPFGDKYVNAITKPAKRLNESWAIIAAAIITGIFGLAAAFITSNNSSDNFPVLTNTAPVSIEVSQNDTPTSTADISNPHTPTLQPSLTFSVTPTDLPPTQTPTATNAVTTSFTPTFTDTSTPTFPSVEIIRGVILRSGPGSQYPQIATLSPGSLAEIVRVSDDGAWYEMWVNDQKLWFTSFDAFRVISGNLSSVPVALAPTFTWTPSYTATNTTSSTPTHTSTSTFPFTAVLSPSDTVVYQTSTLSIEPTSVSKAYPCTGTIRSNGNQPLFVIYNSPSRLQTPIASVSPGTTVNVIGDRIADGRQWYQITYGNQKIGWLWDTYISLDASCP
jgi:hypothetical protein